MSNMIEMRKVYGDTLREMARKDPRVCVINSDSRNISFTGEFEKEFPERAFNVGIAEANMVSIAGGLAVSGYKPFAHAFGPFMTRRVLDQLTISLAYGKLNAVLVGMSPGITTEINGGTHQCYEDIAAVRGVANLTIVEPFDPVQLAQMLPQLIELDGPVYMRYDRVPTPVFHDENYRYQLGKADVLRDGRDVTIISSGCMLFQCLEAADELAKIGVSARVIDMHTIKPIDEEALVKAAQETGRIVTVENHNIIGGLGSAVAEVLCEKAPCPMRRIGIRDRFGEVGFRPYLRETFGIDTRSIVAAALDF